MGVVESCALPVSPSVGFCWSFVFFWEVSFSSFSFFLLAFAAALRFKLFSSSFLAFSSSSSAFLRAGFSAFFSASFFPFSAVFESGEDSAASFFADAFFSAPFFPFSSVFDSGEDSVVASFFAGFLTFGIDCSSRYNIGVFFFPGGKVTPLGRRLEVKGGLHCGC